MRASPALLVVLLAVQAVQASPREAVVQALQDAKRLPADVRYSTRYLALYAVPEGKRAEFLAALNYGVNAVSREAELVRARQVSPDLVALDIRDYGWKREVWEKIADVGVEPYFHVVLEEQGQAAYPPRQRGSDGFSWWVWVDGRWIPEGSYRHPQGGTGKRISAAAPWLPTKETGELIYLTQSQAPVVRADWFLAQLARNVSLSNNKDNGIGYYSFLAIRNRDDYFKLVGLDEQASLKVKKEIRAVVDLSGVSQHNRQVVRLNSILGGAWVTLDVADESGKGNAVLNLKRGELAHVAEEWISPLPNGLGAFFLGDNKGVRQDSAPDTIIGPDDSPGRIGRDGRVHVHLSCVRCHADAFLQPVDDVIRRTFVGDLQLQSPDHETLRALRRQYLSNLDAHLARDRAAYAEAIHEATGLKPADLSKAFAAAWNSYAEAPLSPEQAARELGVDVQRMRTAVRTYTAKGLANPELANLGMDPLRVPLRRVKWETNFALAMSVVGGGP